VLNKNCRQLAHRAMLDHAVSTSAKQPNITHNTDVACSLHNGKDAARQEQHHPIESANTPKARTTGCPTAPRAPFLRPVPAAQTPPLCTSPILPLATPQILPPDSETTPCVEPPEPTPQRSPSCTDLQIGEEDAAAAARDAQAKCAHLRTFAIALLHICLLALHVETARAVPVIGHMQHACGVSCSVLNACDDCRQDMQKRAARAAEDVRLAERMEQLRRKVGPHAREVTLGDVFAQDGRQWVQQIERLEKRMSDDSDDGRPAVSIRTRLHEAYGQGVRSFAMQSPP
jgi:hypothetical protein